MFCALNIETREARELLEAYRKRGLHSECEEVMYLIPNQDAEIFTNIVDKLRAQGADIENVLSVGGALYSFFIKGLEGIEVSDAVEINPITSCSQEIVGRLLCEGKTRKEITRLLRFSDGHILRSNRQCLARLLIPLDVLDDKVQDLKTKVTINASDEVLTKVLGDTKITPDINPHNLENGLPIGLPDNLYLSDVLDFNPGKSYDLILTNNVLEWILKKQPSLPYQSGVDPIYLRFKNTILGFINKIKTFCPNGFYLESSCLIGESLPEYWEKLSEEHPEVLSIVELGAEVLGYGRPFDESFKKPFTYGKNITVVKVN